MLEQLRRSLSFRLLAIFAVLAIAFVYFATVGIRWVYSEDDLRELISGHLSLHVEYVRRDIGIPPNIDRAIAITRQVPVDIRISGENIEWASDPNFPAMDELNFGASDIFSEDPGALLGKLTDVEFAVDGPHRFLKIKQGNFDIVVSSPRIADTNSGPDLLPIILSIGLVWLFIAYVCVSWLFRPIRSIREGAALIGKGKLEHRISGHRKDQLGDLADDINKLAGDVRAMLDAKRQLLLGISHELRSPLSRLRLALEFIDDSDQKEDVRAEISEMEQIIATLLEAERLNSRHAKLNRTSVLVNDLIEQLIENFFARDLNRIEISLEDKNIEANVDDVRLILILKNLLSNALRYSSTDDGRVRVNARLDGSDLVVTVEDDGPGISPEQAENLGEPFFRGDPSRTRETGGTGLGLYLAKLAAEAHGGTLSVDRQYTRGARLVVRLPS
ncbi:MAG: ATP-binding protein [Gammaproteobacteria bacterium]|jgi:signal transduction histidine kinase|nr:ATP-binding protein [Gammaproteobacteria bacterium]